MKRLLKKQKLFDHCDKFIRCLIPIIIKKYKSYIYKFKNILLNCICLIHFITHKKYVNFISYNIKQLSPCTYSTSHPSPPSVNPPSTWLHFPTCLHSIVVLTASNNKNPSINFLPYVLISNNINIKRLKHNKSFTFIMVNSMFTYDRHEL